MITSKNSGKHHMNFHSCVCFFIAAVSAALILMPGCTPESPPLDPLQPSQTSESYAKESSKASEAETSSSASKASADESSKVSESVKPDISVTEDIKGELTEATFRYTDEAPTAYYTTDDKNMLKKLSDALGSIKIVKECTDSSGEKGVILFFTGNNNSGRISFDNGCYVKDGKQYEIDGYDKLEAVLKEIKDNYPEWSKKYDEWIHKMSAAENRIQELCTSDEYKNSDTDGKRKQALELLNKLTDEGLIKKGSVYDSGDTISYTFNCSDEGVLGAIKLTDFDPMMN